MKFLLIEKEITQYSKRDIDQGLCPRKINIICCCLRTCFCLSYAIRKYNDLYLFFYENNIAIKFIGKQLRFLGPDERSQALLLNKVLNRQRSGKHLYSWTESTPGIYIKRFDTFKIFLNEFLVLDGTHTFLIQKDGNGEAIDTPANFPKMLKSLKKDGKYILALYNNPEFNNFDENSLITNKDKIIKNITFKRIKKAPDQLLLLNYWIDIEVSPP